MLKLLKNISTYSLGGILSKSIQFLLLPLYTRVLVPADYGKLELIYMVGVILVILYGFLVENGYVRIYFDKSEDPDFRERLFGTAFSFMLLCSLVFSVVGVVFSKEIAGWVFNFENGTIFVKLICISTFLEALSHIPYKNLLVQKKAKQYVSVNIINLLITISFTIYLVVFLRMGVEGILYAKIGGGLIQLIILSSLTFKKETFFFSTNQLSEMLGFSVFLILPNLSSVILLLSNRFILQKYQTLDEVGIFSLGYKIAAIIPILLTEPVKKAFGPYIFSLSNDPPKCKESLRIFTGYFLAGILTFAFVISLYSRELIMIMSDKSYYSSYTIVFILAISYVFLGLSGIIVLGIHVTKKTWIVTLIWPLAATINLTLNFILIPSYGKMGAAITALVSFMFINFAYFFALSKVYYVRFEYIKYLFLLLITIVFYWVSTFLHFGIVMSIISKTLLLFVYLLVLLLSGFFSPLLRFKLLSKLELLKSVVLHYDPFLNHK